MTSKSLFFKLMKEDLKRKTWAMGLALLAFFFAMPMQAAMYIGSIGKDYRTNLMLDGNGSGDLDAAAQKSRQMLESVARVLGFENFLLCFFIVCAALVFGITGFLYLHSRKQMDFYHSLPVKRETLFAVKFLDGFLILLAAYLMDMLVTMGIYLANGMSFGFMIRMTLYACLTQMLSFLLIYGTVVLAVILTGNFFIAVCAIGTFFLYMPAVGLLIEELKNQFFVTMNTDETASICAKFGSPIGFYVNLMSIGARSFGSVYNLDMNDMGNFMAFTVEKEGTSLAELVKFWGIGSAACLVLIVLALFLYRKRPSEAAGRAMAFGITKAPIKILLVIPVTVAASDMAWSIYYSKVWAVFGFALGLFLTSCVMEIIYHFDFGKLFANWWHMIPSGVAACLILMAFWLDLFGYDSFLPQESEFESAAINLNLDYSGDFGSPYPDGDSYSWRYYDSESYVNANMKITDYETVCQLAQKGIDTAKENRKYKLSGDYSSYQENNDYMIYMQVTYRMKNGKIVKRAYNAGRTELDGVLDNLYATKDYKTGVYPVMKLTSEEVNGLYVNSLYGISNADVSDETREKILESYQEELAALTLNERAECVPLFSLRFLTEEEETYLNKISKNHGSYGNGFNLNDMQDVNFYPVYPSFTRTIACLAEAGIDMKTEIPADDVERIEITYPDEYLEGGGTITVINDGSRENTDKIEAVLQDAVPVSMVNLNALCQYESGLDVTIFSKGKSFSYYFAGDVPEFVKTLLNYDEIENKYINIGIGVNESH